MLAEANSLTETYRAAEAEHRKHAATATALEHQAAVGQLGVDEAYSAVEAAHKQGDMLTRELDMCKELAVSGGDGGWEW